MTRFIQCHRVGSLTQRVRKLQILFVIEFKERIIGIQIIIRLIEARILSIREIQILIHN